MEIMDVSVAGDIGHCELRRFRRRTPHQQPCQQAKALRSIPFPHLGDDSMIHAWFGSGLNPARRYAAKGGQYTHLIGSWTSSDDNSYSGPSASSSNMLEDAEDVSEGLWCGDDVASSDKFEADEQSDPLDASEKEAFSELLAARLLQISSWPKGAPWDAELQDIDILGDERAPLKRLEGRRAVYVDI
ncbi:hypothetical protein EJB05_24929 [Eragrostis curvula]|uniref:Uncharacterized protein n=1 Tax=Eragrostis curvula TaxID=38414 RepID=A0A5J9VAQ9_9POAL|nr:hypothetical protein EJB05_24929 [Eragrostis curvula]